MIEKEPISSISQIEKEKQKDEIYQSALKKVDIEDFDDYIDSNVKKVTPQEESKKVEV